MHKIHNSGINIILVIPLCQFSERAPSVKEEINIFANLEKYFFKHKLKWTLTLTQACLPPALYIFYSSSSSSSFIGKVSIIMPLAIYIYIQRNMAKTVFHMNTIEYIYFIFKNQCVQQYIMSSFTCTCI